MQLILKDNLPYVEVVIEYQGLSVKVFNVLVDTGSASTIFATDVAESINIKPLPEDTLHVIRGVGGSEVVYKRQVDFLRVGDFGLLDFEIEIGGMDYGFEINGILGMDFLTNAGAVINLQTMQISIASKP